jgi:hypothetical protein
MSWESFFIGMSMAVIIWPLLSRGYKNILVRKAEDGTAEYIGGKAYYIITNDDWKLLEAWRIPLLRRGDCAGCGITREKCASSQALGALSCCPECHHYGDSHSLGKHDE